MATSQSGCLSHYNVRNAWTGHTHEHTWSLALYSSCKLHVPSESDVGGQQVAHADHTRHYHHGETEPVRSKETTESCHLLPSYLHTVIPRLSHVPKPQ